jgi:hypothetical protein
LQLYVALFLFTLLSLEYEDRSACKSGVPLTMLSPYVHCLTMPPASSVGICFRFHVSNLRYRPDFNLISLRDSNAHENILTVSPLFSVTLEIFIHVFPYHSQRSHIIHTISNKNASVVRYLHSKCIIFFPEVRGVAPRAIAESWLKLDSC